MRLVQQQRERDSSDATVYESDLVRRALASATTGCVSRRRVAWRAPIFERRPRWLSVSQTVPSSVGRRSRPSTWTAWLPAWSAQSLAWSSWLTLELHDILSSLATAAGTVVSDGRSRTRAQQQLEALELCERESLLGRRRAICDCWNGCRNLCRTSPEHVGDARPLVHQPTVVM